MSSAPSILTAKELFLTELPRLIADIQAKNAPAAADFSKAHLSQIHCDVECQVEGQGMYTLSIKGDQAPQVRRGGAANPLLTLTLSTQAWQHSQRVIGKVMQALYRLLSSQGGAAVSMMNRTLRPAGDIIAALASAPLLLRFEILSGDFAALSTLAIAGAEEGSPSVTLTLQEEDFLALLEGRLSPQAAAQEKRLKISGAMTTGMSLLSKLTKPHT